MNHDEKRDLGVMCVIREDAMQCGQRELILHKSRSGRVHSELYKLEIFQIHLKLWE